MPSYRFSVVFWSRQHVRPLPGNAASNQGFSCRLAADPRVFYVGHCFTWTRQSIYGGMPAFMAFPLSSVLLAVAFCSVQSPEELGYSLLAGGAGTAARIGFLSETSLLVMG